MSDDEDLQGFAAIPRWLQRDRTISWQAKAVYATLSTYSDKFGRSFPSHATIAADIPCSVSAVKTALGELRALGVVDWSRRRKGDGGQTSNVYQLSTTATVDNRPAPPSHEVTRGVDNPGTIAKGWLGGSHQVATNKSQINEDNKSSQRSSSAPVDKPARTDDRASTIPTPAGVPSHPQAVTWSRVLEQVSPVYSTFSIDVLTVLGREILARASAVVLNPQAYIVHALTNHDQLEWQTRAFDIDVDRAQRGGNQF